MASISLRWAGLALGPTLFALVIVLPVETPNAEAKAVLALTAWMATWWISEAIPLYATSLLPLILFPLFGVATMTELPSSYADRIIFLLLGGFIIAAAIERSGLHERFALNAMRLFGASPRRMVAGFMATTAAVSAFLSNTSTTLMVLPIAAAAVAQVRDPRERMKFGACLMLGIAYSASIGGVSTLLGTPPNLIFASLTKSITGINVNFGQFLLVGVPVSAVLLLAGWWYLVTFGARINGAPLNDPGMSVEKRLRELGPPRRHEKVVAAVFAGTVLAWITRGVVWGAYLPVLDDSAIALISATVLLAAPGGEGGRAVDWETVGKVPWGVLLLLGGGLALASGFVATGLDQWIAEKLILSRSSDLLLVLALLVVFTILTGEIISNTAGAALMIPIAASAARLVGVNPIVLMLAVALASSLNFALPVATPPNAIVYGRGYVTLRQMIKAGLVLDALTVVVVITVSLLIAPVVWG